MTPDLPAPAEAVEPPATAGRDQAGRFRPGQSGNPAGRPKGARHVALRAVETIGEENAEALMRRAVELALDGDVQALRILLDRLYPVRRGRPVNFDLGELRTADDAAAAASSVLREVAAGRMTPEEGGAVAALLQAHREAVLMRDADARLRALEGRDGKRG